MVFHEKKEQVRGQKGTNRGQNEKVWKPLILLGKTGVKGSKFHHFVPLSPDNPFIYYILSFTRVIKG